MLVDWFSRWAVYQPEKLAVEEYASERAWTFRQINRLGNALKEWFSGDLGLCKGDRVAVLADNCLEYIALFAAAQKTGIILVPLNYRLTPRELDYMLNDCEPLVIFSEDKYLDKLKKTNAFSGISNTFDLKDLEDRCERILLMGEPEQAGQTQTAGVAGATGTAGTTGSGTNTSQTSENDPLFLIYTSGTTAFPKASIYTHKMLFWNSINTEMRLDITSSDRSINCAPPFHTGSWNVLLTPFLHHGAYTLLMKQFDPDAVLDALENRDMTIFWAVPTMLKMIMESPKFDNATFKKVRYFIVGGEAMPLPLIEAWHKKGVFIRQGYGLTEVGPNVTSLNHEDATRKIGSIGTPNFYYQTRIVNSEGEDTAPGEPGEFLLKGPNVTPGYWRNPEATIETIRDGWFYTGDIVTRDEEGFIFVVDRIKNMYISGGENVYPAEIEFLLAKHPAIDSVAIIGVTDPTWGESGKAFIVVKKNRQITAEEITDYCTRNLAKYKVPKHIHFMDALPKNDAGKIDRKQLKYQS